MGAYGWQRRKDALEGRSVRPMPDPYRHRPKAEDVLREAAALMREQHGPDHKRHAMWSAMADLLEAEADAGEMDGLWRSALAVARAYLAAVDA